MWNIQKLCFSIASQRHRVNKPVLRVQNLYNNGNLFLNKQQTLKFIQRKLTQLFTNHQSKILLSKTFRIFPSFFSNRILTNLINSQFIDEYLQHIFKTKQILNNKHTQNVKQQQQEHPLRQLKQTLNRLKMSKQIQRRILQVYINFVKRTQDLTENEILMEIFDIRNPQNWFKSSTIGERRFVYHHGPTNSGKTYSAINQLRNLKSDQKGIYMAPLRLLAWQTQQKLGKCNLVTGQQKDYQNSNVTSCTIEAAKLNQIFDVAIIDEIQMIGDTHRGWSWTTPLLGIKANKIHLCGDERALHLVSRIIQKCGGSLQQKKYNRLSKLHLIKKNFNISDLKPGDCIIDFSSNKLYKYRQRINKLKGTANKPNTTAIIYGKLPPICRKAQAEKFNSGQLPYLVASDAIGMGLNLKIRRIIFINIRKMGNQGKQKILEDHQIRQIAGRAGRGYGTGYVQCVNSDIRERVKHALRNVNLTIDQNNEQIQKQFSNDQNYNYSNFERKQLTDKEFNQQQNNQTYNGSITGEYSKYLKRYLKEDQMKIKRAGIFFPISIIERIKVKMEKILGENLKISETIKLIIQLSKQNKDLYFVQANEQLIQLSNELSHLQFPFQLHYLFSQIPVPSLSRRIKTLILNYAKQFKDVGRVRIPEQIENMYKQNFSNFTQLSQIKKLQENFSVVEAYTWLWNHLQLYFPQNEKAVQIKNAICNKMNDLLKQAENSKMAVPATSQKQVNSANTTKIDQSTPK